MDNRIFRKKNMEQIASPEQLDDYIHVSNPSAWVVISAFAVLLIGICIWGIFGKLDTVISVAAAKEAEGVVCYVRESDYQKIEIGMTVEINSEAFVITEIEKTPVLVDPSIPEYAKHIGTLNDGEWIYIVRTDCGMGVVGEIFSAEIIIERINPLYFVTN